MGSRSSDTWQVRYGKGKNPKPAVIFVVPVNVLARVAIQDEVG